MGRCSPWSSSVAAGTRATLPAAAASFTSVQLSFANSYVIALLSSHDGSPVPDHAADAAQGGRVVAEVALDCEQVGAQARRDVAGLRLDPERRRGGRGRCGHGLRGRGAEADAVDLDAL